MPKRTDIKKILSRRFRPVVRSTSPKMTLLAVAAVCLSSLVFAARAQVVVVVQEVRPSAQKPLITVLRDGAKQEGARLAVFAADGQQKLTLTTDSHGRAKLPYVRPGKYCITASTSPTLRADLCLQIASTHSRRADEFQMELAVQPPPPPTLQEKLQAAEKVPVALRTRFFSGAVRDIQGAVIARASVAVYRQGTGDATHPLEIATDSHGHFATALTPGKYTAVIQSPGFERQLLTFEISPDAPEQELNVKLNVGAISEVVSVARTNCNP